MEQHAIENLVELAEAGDEQALAQLFDQYRDRLRRMVDLRMNENARARFDPSDVVQEAFVEVARQISIRREVSNIPFFLWIRMVTGDRLAHLHRTHLGTEKRDAFREISLNKSMPEATSICLATQLAGQFTSADRGLIREEVNRKLEESLNAMDSDDREVIAMKHFEELSTEEIATVLKITRSGVLKRYARAIRRLSKAINTSSDISVH